MRTLYMLVGLPGSGKTTFAKTAENMGLSVVSIDDFSKDMKAINPNVEYQDIDKMAVSVVACRLINSDVIFDACCNTTEYRNWVENSIDCPHKTEYIVFPINPEVCLQRVHKRNEKTNQFYSEDSFFNRVKEFEFPSKEEDEFTYYVRSKDDVINVAKIIKESMM